MYYKACTKHFPVLLCTTKLAQSTSQYYFALQSLQKGIPILLCTAKLAQVLTSTTLYYKACTTHFPVALGTTKIAQSTSQHHFVLQSSHQYNFVLRSFHKTLPFVLQSLHKVPRTTLYYKACTKPVPVILCTTNLAQSTSQHYFVLESLHTTLPKTHQALTHSKLFHTASFSTQQAFTHSKHLLHKERVNSHTASFYAEKLLHLESFRHTESFYTQKALRTASFCTKTF